MGTAVRHLETVGPMSDAPSGTELLERITRALGQVRAEYESDEDLYSRFSPPLYFNQLTGITPSFLIGGRGTGKTTTLRSMSFGAQERISGSPSPSHWQVVGSYWKVEPNVVSVFRGRGLELEVWSRVFSHYLNLKLASLVIDYAAHLEQAGQRITPDSHQIELFRVSMNLAAVDSVTDIGQQIDLALVAIESRINGNISSLADAELSILGRPLDYLFAGLGGLGVSRQTPFMFCLDEYENLIPYQQVLLNTLIKQVGAAPYTFKIGVRNTLAIDRSTQVAQQPLQDPADFTTVDIVNYLKDESFDEFAATVVSQRLALVQQPPPDPGGLLPPLPVEVEAEMLGAIEVRDSLRSRLAGDEAVTSEDLQFLDEMSPYEACMIAKWAEAHTESELEVLSYARSEPKKWGIRLGNYGYAMLFTIRQNRVGERKYYCGWKTYCQLADGNIRYLIRLVHEALRLHATAGGRLESQVSFLHQTRAAARVGETTIRDLQSWSKQGAALTRLALGLGSIFGSLARETALTTPEVDQFRVSYAGSVTPSDVVDELLSEAVGQGILVAFDADKNPRMSGATREMDFQLHSVLAPYFVYSSRRKRRMTLRADDVIALTSREQAAPTIRRILHSRGANSGDLPNQLLVFGSDRDA